MASTLTKLVATDYMLRYRYVANGNDTTDVTQAQLVADAQGTLAAALAAATNDTLWDDLAEADPHIFINAVPFDSGSGRVGLDFTTTAPGARVFRIIGSGSVNARIVIIFRHSIDR